MTETARKPITSPDLRAQFLPPLDRIAAGGQVAAHAPLRRHLEEMEQQLKVAPQRA